MTLPFYHILSQFSGPVQSPELFVAREKEKERMEGLLGRAWNMGVSAYDAGRSALSNFSWGNTSPLEIVNVSHQQLGAMIPLENNNPPFGLFQQQNKERTIHVILHSRFSVHRTNSQPEAFGSLASFRKHSSIFTNFADRNDNKMDRLVDSVHKHPRWESVHLLCFLGWPNYLSSIPAISLNKALCDPEQQSPLQIACQFGQQSAVSFLLKNGVDLSLRDPNGQNAVHHAALCSGSEASAVIGLLASQGNFSQVVNERNLADFTPLSLAVRNRNAVAVSALINAGARADLLCQNRTVLQEAIQLGEEPSAIETTRALVGSFPALVLQPDLNGDTALHTVRQSRILDVLLGACSEVDVANKLGRTPLHSASLYGRVSCVVKLLAHGAQPDKTDTEGNTPLHLIVQAKLNTTPEIVKVLLLFQANPMIRNSKGQTAFDLSSKLATAERDIVQGCIRLMSDQTSKSALLNSELSGLEEFAQSLSVSETVRRVHDAGQNKRKVLNLLSLDGGGIRGLVLIQTLLHLESRLGAPLWPMFHWVAGTSTGAILAVALAQGRSLRDCQRLYFRFKDEVFQGSRPFDTRVLENFLKSEIGANKTMADIEHPKLVVTAVKADLQPVKLKLFRNYLLPVNPEENKQMGYLTPNSQLLWYAARCSSAAPTYFASVEEKYVDGGLVSNNPTLDLLSEVQTHNIATKYANIPSDVVDIGCVLSLGTGQVPERASRVDVASASGSITDVVATAFAAVDLKDILIDQVTATDGRPVDRSRAWCQSMGVPFFRFSPQLSKDVPLDATSDSVLIQMLWETECYLRTRQRNEVDCLIEVLRQTSAA